MVSYLNGGATYLYDAHGLRVRSSASYLGTRYHVYSRAGKLIYAQDEGRDLRSDFIYLGDTLVAQRDQPVFSAGNTVTYLHSDYRGTPSVETNSIGQVQRRNLLKAYGEPYDGQRKEGPGFTKHANDTIVGMVYMQQRYYDPEAMRFISGDSVGAGPVSFNRFWYANANPYTFNDPDGRIADVIADVGFVAYSAYTLFTEPSWTNAVALGADIVGAGIPFATGLGAGVRAGAKADEGIELTLRAKDGWTAEQTAQAAEKAAELDRLAKDGLLTVTKKPERAATSASSRYRQSGGDVPQGNDVDHVQDLQLGGADVLGNMKPLDSSVNRSLGAQINHQTRDVPAGTRICSVRFEC